MNRARARPNLHTWTLLDICSESSSRQTNASQVDAEYSTGEDKTIRVVHNSLYQSWRQVLSTHSISVHVATFKKLFSVVASVSNFVLVFQSSRKGPHHIIMYAQFRSDCEPGNVSPPPSPPVEAQKNMTLSHERDLITPEDKSFMELSTVSNRRGEEVPTKERSGTENSHVYEPVIIGSKPNDSPVVMAKSDRNKNRNNSNNTETNSPCETETHINISTPTVSQWHIDNVHLTEQTCGLIFPTCRKENLLQMMCKPYKERVMYAENIITHRNLLLHNTAHVHVIWCI